MNKNSTNKILDLGCGKNKYPGAIGIDFNKNTNADIIHNLDIFPYPFGNNEFDTIVINHSIEHLDDVVRVMEEVHRIAKPDAHVLINAPYFTSVDAFTDPTHKHFFTARSFDYFTGDFESFGYYSDVKFRKLKVEIRFWEWKRFKWFRLQNWLGLGLLANKFTKFYEVFFAHIFPAREIHYELQIIKQKSDNNDSV
ncbi:MAG: class I SAM-dependent methyltransferase [Phycisphaerae bacterium]|jgi:SAM-dependent methyltransferase